MLEEFLQRQSLGETPPDLWLRPTTFAEPIGQEEDANGKTRDGRNAVPRPPGPRSEWQIGADVHAIAPGRSWQTALGNNHPSPGIVGAPERTLGGSAGGRLRSALPSGKGRESARGSHDADERKEHQNTAHRKAIVSCAGPS